MMKMNDFIKMLDLASVEYYITNRTDGLVAVWVISNTGETCFKFDANNGVLVRV